MKISPMTSSVNTVGAVEGSGESLRSIKMVTNATPGPAGPLEEVQKLTIQDDIEAKPVDEVTQPISPQLAELARARRALQVKERAIVDREKALESRSQDVNLIDRARLKSDPLGVLLETGVTYDQLTEAILNGQGNAEMAALKAELHALKEGVDKKFVEKDTQAEQQVLAEMRREALRLSSQGEAFEMVRETRSIPDVMKLIERTYRETGEVLETTEALRLVEDELVSRYKKLANLKKVQSQLAPAPAQLQLQPQRQGMRTLTNKDTASPVMTPKARALAAFYGTLKK